MRRKRPRNAVRAIAIATVVHPDDLLAARTAASVPHTPRASLDEVCADLNMAFHDLVKGLSADLPRPEIEAIGQDLRKLAAACDAVMAPLGAELRDMPENADELLEFGRHLADGGDPLVWALLAASEGSDPSKAAADRVVLAFAMVRHLGRWAEAAATQFSAGAKAANDAARLDQRRQAVVFGTKVIEAYAALTGRTPGISRSKPGDDEDGKPGGPLIRFALTFYERLRARYGHDRLLDAPGLHRALNPTAETIASWTQLYQR